MGTSTTRARLIDIANAAGVSMTTASYVMNDRPVAIPKETRQRILQIARELNYLPNRMARNLAQRTSGLIGVLSPMNGSPFHARLTAELNEYAAAVSYKMVFEAVNILEGGEASYQTATDRLLQWRVDGLLLWSDDGVRTVRADCPTVSMGPSQRQDSDAHHVAIDLYSGARSATEHLLALGHRDLCFVGHPDLVSDVRWMAVCETVSDAGLPSPMHLRKIGEEDDLRAAATRLTRQSRIPTGFICISDVQALEVFRGLRNGGLRIPADASIVSCDETWAAENVDPPLTAVSIPFRETTKLALDTLLSRIQEGEPPRNGVASPTLTIRGSTAAPRH